MLTFALPLLVLVSLDFGATWDEPQQRQKAHHLLAYWQGRSPALEVPDDGAHLYGAPLDVLAAWLEPLVPFDPYVIRHGVIACTAWMGLVFTGLLALRLFGGLQAVLAVVLLVASPLFMAHATNNPKDLPFAVTAAAWLLALARLPAHAPFLMPRDMALLAIILGIGLNVRAGALLLWVYLAVVVIYRTTRTVHPLWELAATAAPRLLAVLGGGVGLGWVAWPWAYDHPLSAPFRGLSMLSRFPWGGQVLFDGGSYAGVALPDSYVPTWLWMSLPPVVLAGGATSILLLRTRHQASTIGLWSSVVFPILYVMGTRATLYDGIRHLLFVIPPLAVLASAGIVHLIRVLSPRARTLATVVLAIGLFEPVWFQLRNHPNQAAYIQPLAGGPSRAFGRFDLDYWGNCMLQALRQIPDGRAGPPVVTGWPLIILQANAPRVPGVTVVGDDDPRAVYDVRLVRGSRSEVLSLTSSASVVSRVATTDGATLCIVMSRQAASAR